MTLSWIRGLAIFYSKPLFSAFFLGLLAALALPPVNATIVLLVVFPAFCYLLDKVSEFKRALILGWCFGFGHFIALFYWVTWSLFVDIKQFFWAIPFALVGLPAVAACYIAVWAALVYVLPSRTIYRWLCASACWIVVEYGRGSLLSGFPWMLVGYTAVEFSYLMQLASLVGVYGVGLVMITWALSPYVWWKDRNPVPFIVCTALLMMGAMFGWWRTHSQTAYMNSSSYQAAQKTIWVRLVQANISQSLKWDEESFTKHLALHIDLSRGNIAGTTDVPDLIIWPEAAVTIPLNLYPSLQMRISQAIQKPSAYLITGTLREDISNTGHRGLWNSLQLINAAGQIVGNYDKKHLVPFGEYIPARSYLPFSIQKLTYGLTDFTPGFEEQPPLFLHSLNTHISPLICYEAIFPGRLNVDQIKGTRQFILQLTNDAWFGLTSGPYQHLEMARMRAVEEGKPLVRVAGSGVSAVIDAFGRVISSIPLEKKGVIDVILPNSLPSNTLYQQVREFGTWSFVLLFLSYSLLANAIPVLRERIKNRNLRKIK